MTWRKDLESKGEEDGAYIVLLRLFMCQQYFCMYLHCWNIKNVLLSLVERLGICAVVFLMCNMMVSTLSTDELSGLI